MANDSGIAQSDLAELLNVLGMGDHARPQSPHEVFQEALGVLRKRLAEHPTNDTLQKLGAFDRKTRVNKHTATHWGYLRGVIDALDAAGHSDAADVLVWQVWHRVNSAARHNEFYRLVLEEKAGVERDYHLLCQEERRLRRLLEDGPGNPQECAEFCRTARDDGDGKPCLDCDPERFCIV